MSENVMNMEEVMQIGRPPCCAIATGAAFDCCAPADSSCGEPTAAFRLLRLGISMMVLQRDGFAD